jgi:hypothetical protein
MVLPAILLYVLLQFLDLFCILYVPWIRLFHYHGGRIHVLAAKPVRKLRVGRKVFQQLILDRTG